jgi:DNA-binding NarL/FixJ family response regulator
MAAAGIPIGKKGMKMSRYSILLADDHPLFRQGIRRILDESADLEVVGEAGDGLELLALMETVSPRMVILDISMPRMCGIEAINGIKMKSPEAKVLVLSMHREYLYHALSAGADGYLLKEDAGRDIFIAIDDIRQGKTYLSPRLRGELILDSVPFCQTLSSREKEVLKLLGQGKSKKEIAEILFVDNRTVRKHSASIARKLKLKPLQNS